MANKKKPFEKGAIEIVEEAVHQLRLQPVTLLACYYIGTLPFILALLYFWVDMSKSAFAADHCVAASFGLALLFIWMKSWQAVFSGKMKNSLIREQVSRWSLGRLLRLCATQSIVHATGFVVLPVALLLTIPYGWCYAFYQNIVLFGDGGERTVQSSCALSWSQAKLWPRQNTMLLLIISGLGVVLFLNLGVILFWFPLLLKRFFDIDSLSAMSGIWFVLNTTFLAVTCCLSYLCLDPLIKTIYVLRCYYGSSLQTGEDLQAELKRLQDPGRVALSVVLFFMAFALIPAICSTAEAGVKAPSFEKTIFMPTDLERSISKVLENPKYAWRLPRQKEKENEIQEPDFLDEMVAWIADGLRSVLSTIGRWLDKLKELLRQLMPDLTKLDNSSSGMPDLVYTASILFGLLVLFFLWLIWQARKRRCQGQTKQSDAIEVKPLLPDIRNDAVRADEAMGDSWLFLAEGLKQKGELRLALRAMYLATLAHLAEKQLITIARFKSNNEYMHELKRRVHSKQKLVWLFRENNLMFDKVWYGRHIVKAPEVEHFSMNYKHILAYADE